MKREYKDRPTSLEDVVRKYLESLPLEQRLRAALEYEARKKTIVVNNQKKEG